MDPATVVRHPRGGRVNGVHDGGRGRPHSRNLQWVPGEGGGHRSGIPHHTDGGGGERWERGGHRGGRGVRGGFRGGRGKFPNASLRVARKQDSILNQDPHIGELVNNGAGNEGGEEQEEPELETAEEKEKFWQELVKAREVERKRAIADGKMDDPAIPKRLEDAICVVGTCMDMCPRFERYRRERENNLFEWECIPGTKRVDHKRAVKMYERAAGDKTLPSDLRPPEVLKRTLDYLFDNLLPRGGFSPTFSFIRDRSRAVRNDFTMQHNHGPIAIECHDRCARFHILALHVERSGESFSVALEEQQLMNTLQSLKEFYEEQRGSYESPTELEMRVYHRLIHIRDQKERHDDIPEHILSHPVFKLTTDFRLHVQKKSAPITKTSNLVVDAESMQIFGQLAAVLRDQGNVVMIYLVACILERHFGADAIEDIDSLRGDLTFSDIIDGVSVPGGFAEDYEEMHDEVMEDELQPVKETETVEIEHPLQNGTIVPGVPHSVFQTQPKSIFSSVPTAPQPTAFSTITSTPNVFSTPSPFGGITFPSTSTSTSVFGATPPKPTFAAPEPSSSRAPPPTSAHAAVIPTSNVVQNDFLNISTTSSEVSTKLATAQPLVFPSGFSQQSRATPFFPQPPSSDLSQSTSTLPDNNTSKLNANAPAFTPSFIPPPLESQSRAAPQSSAFPNPTSTASNASVAPTDSRTTPSATPWKRRTPPISARKSKTPPVLPRLNTDPLTISIQQSPFPSSKEPPSSPRLHPVPLPSVTPTPSLPSSALPGALKNDYFTAVSQGLNQDILSPISLQTPTLSRAPTLRNFPSHGKLRTGLDSPGVSSVFGKGKFPERRLSDKSTVNELELQNKADQFLSRSDVVKSSFRRWHELVLKKAAWYEACQQSENYSQKIKRQRDSLSSSANKRRISTASPSATMDSPQKKRARRRISGTYQPPRTDEELAQRLKENHAEHERRWKRGSFLNVIRDHVKAKLDRSVLHSSWSIWLSMNTESDPTAIWVERKFDVPSSGEWVNDAVFSIPFTEKQDPAMKSGSPGLIVFERTPFDGMDELERKYRVLDDCARLRDIVNALPAKRHFVASLLIISWTEEEKTKTASDFDDMVAKLIADKLIQIATTFAITTSAQDLDAQLEEHLKDISLDLEGSLVRSLSIRGAFKLFEPAFSAFTLEWVENCSINGFFDWHLFGQLVQAVVALLDDAVRSVCRLLSEDGWESLPPFPGGDVVDNDSAYRTVMTWLASIEFGTLLDNTIITLQSHQTVGQEFPARTLFEHLWELVQSHTESRLKANGPETAKFYVSNADLLTVLEAYQRAYQPHHKRLGQVLHLMVRRSPKRRSMSIDNEEAMARSQTKRPRLSSPAAGSVIDLEELDVPPAPGPLSPPASQINGRLTPSPTPTHTSIAPSEGGSTSGQSGVVTAAMLRALASDMRKKYGVAR